MRSLRFESIADRVRTASGRDRPGYAVVPTASPQHGRIHKQSGRLRTQAGRPPLAVLTPKPELFFTTSEAVCCNRVANE